MRDAEPDTAYTRTEIQQAFEEELSRHTEIKGDIEALLSTGRKKESGTPYALDGWAMEITGCAWQTCQKDAGSRKSTLIL